MDGFDKKNNFRVIGYANQNMLQKPYKQNMLTSFSLKNHFSPKKQKACTQAKITVEKRIFFTEKIG